MLRQVWRFTRTWGEFSSMLCGSAVFFIASVGLYVLSLTPEVFSIQTMVASFLATFLSMVCWVLFAYLHGETMDLLVSRAKREVLVVLTQMRVNTRSYWSNSGLIIFNRIRIQEQPLLVKEEPWRAR